MNLDYFADTTTQTPDPFASTGRFRLSDLDPDDFVTVPLARRTWECACCGEEREGRAECGNCGEA